MIFCREFGVLPESGGYLDQPTDVMVRWQDYMVIEAEALETRRKIDEVRAKAKH
jgi:hypothetical protein